jgi:hypothetical protein
MLPIDKVPRPIGQNTSKFLQKAKMEAPRINLKAMVGAVKVRAFPWGFGQWALSVSSGRGPFS